MTDDLVASARGLSSATFHEAAGRKGALPSQIKPDGVVVLEAEGAMKAVAESRRRDQAEQELFKQLRAGATTLQIYQLPQIERS